MDENKALAEDMDKFLNEMPYRGKAYQQLITDKDGNAQWEDRLAYNETIEVSWDGDTTGRVSFTEPQMGTYYKISDLTPGKEEIIGGTVKLSSNYDPVVITQDKIYALGEEVYATGGNGSIIVSFVDNLEVDGVIIPERGTYVWYDGDAYANSLIYGKEKKLAYDYMPEGYPGKEIKPFILMKEQEISFSGNEKGSMDTGLLDVLDIKSGEKLTIIWDGISYDETVRKASLWDSGSGSDIVRESLVFGNLGLIKPYTDMTDCPFVYEALSSGQGRWTTSDTRVTHTIKVICYRPAYTPMDMNFLPNLNIILAGERVIGGKRIMNCNFTYDQIRKWIENDLPIIAIYKKSKSNNFLITNYQLDVGSISLCTAGDSPYAFVYNSDGTLENVTPA